MSILTLFIIIPVLTIIGILFSKSHMQVKWVSVVGMSLQLLSAIALILLYLAERRAGNMAEVLFVQDNVWYETLNIHFYLGVDGVSVAMIGLTALVVFAGIFASWDIVDLPREFFTSLILLAAGVFGFFISLDLFTMFLFYELAVIPMYLLIGIWGSGPRHYSAMKLTLMLMGGSAFILLGVIGIYFNSAPAGGPLTFDLIKISKQSIPLGAQLFLFPFLFTGFGVLGAMFPFHTWSPDGHASAPTAVSMLHAGVLMKLGGYGCYRVAVFLLPEAAHELGWIFLILATIGVIYGALGAVWQKDLKYINAYSSVSHCALVLFAILMFNQTAMNGAIMQMISHGIMTALFFALIGMIYGRTHTRFINEMGGLMKVMPFLGVAYVIAGLASLGLPGFSGFVAEMTIFIGSFQNVDTFHRVATIIAASSIVVTAVYVLRVVGTLLLGKIKNEAFETITDAKWYDKVSVITLIFGITFIGMAPLWLSDMITGGLGPIVQKLLAAAPGIIN
jgi:NADH-quinone oxidoreductase subunit M